MKKTVIMLIALCLVFSVMVFSCASGGKGAAEIGPGIPAVGEPDHDGAINGWIAYADSMDETAPGGMSTAFLEEIEIDGMPAYKLTGETAPGNAWPYSQVEFYPDDATLENFKKTAAISFMVQGDGREYAVQFKITSVTDWCHYSYTFKATAEPVRITIPIGQFIQPSWGTWRRMDTSRFEGIAFQTLGWAYSGKPEPFELTLWDLQVHQ